MDFLKNVLGEELYNQVVTAINAYNGDEAHRESQIKLANLASGEYVGRGKYDALNATLTSKQGELDAANGLIADLQKGTKGNEELQAKITGYETQVTELQAQLAETKRKSAVKVALLSEKALDIDYLTYKLDEKLREKGETLELDENDNIKNWNEHLEGLKVQCPTQFESSGAREYQEHKLETGEGGKGLTRDDVLKKPYSERIKIYQENPETYKEIMKK